MNKKMILAIDPGNIKSGFALIEEDGTPVQVGKVPNWELLIKIKELTAIYKEQNIDLFVVVEMIGSYMMNVGRTIFDTCIFIGRIEQLFSQLFTYAETPYYIERRYVKLNLCNRSSAKDKDIIDALVNRFSPENIKNYGKGTSKNKGFFFGFKADIWQAYALGITYIDILHKRFTIDK